MLDCHDAMTLGDSRSADAFTSQVAARKHAELVKQPYHCHNSPAMPGTYVSVPSICHQGLINTLRHLRRYALNSVSYGTSSQGSFNYIYNYNTPIPRSTMNT
jgi:hypothetical protein